MTGSPSGLGGLHRDSFDGCGKLKDTPANRALHPDVSGPESFRRVHGLPAFRWGDESTALLLGDAYEVVGELAETGIRVNCVVTSPPYYGLRDYGVDSDLGLERDPQDYIDSLVSIFRSVADILDDFGSLWVNIGDTYWSGKGRSAGSDSKQSARRFGMRPQDYPGDGRWTRPKQLLLIPHRFAVAMQEDGWLVRNDNIWVKPNPVPDPVRDRCSKSHEHVFHFTKSRYYYFDRSAAAVPNDRGRSVPPRDTWTVDTARGRSEHHASYPQGLVRIPILSTTPPGGVVLDPFVGTGTTLLFARSHGFRSIGIDLSPDYCDLAATALSSDVVGVD